MAPRTPATMGTTSSSLERLPMTGEPKTSDDDKLHQKKRLKK